jgi:hypothetical protein
MWCIRLVELTERVDASYGGSISTKITLPASPYKIFLNVSNEHGCYFKK